jgi:hypothetical protein
MSSSTKADIYIGIDPDVQASGLAVWDSKEKVIVALSTYTLPEVFEILENYNSNNRIMVRLEAGWLIKGNWHRGGSKLSGNAVGRNHEIGRQIEKYCITIGIPHQLVKPPGYSSYTHQVFCAITRWPIKVSTNTETRVAALLVYGQ